MSELSKIRDNYDVVIIGAGPAGLSCANALGGSKLKVLVIEQKRIIGPKTCAGGLTALNGLLEIPSSKYLSFKKQKMILNNAEYEINLVNPLKTISRLDLGKHQLSLIRRFSNITIKKSVKVKEIGNNFVLTNKNERMYFKKLVGGDGSNSIVRRFLGLENRFYIGVQYIIPGAHNEPVWFLNPRLLRSGYGWIFPHKRFTSAGVYFNPKIISSKKARESLYKLLNDYGFDISDAKFECAPINTLFNGFKFGNISLIGDAAGLASANTGEGISYAITSGHDIGKYIINEAYNFDKINEIIKYKKRQEFVLKIFDTVSIPVIQTMMFKIFIRLIKQPKFQKFYGN